MPIYVVVAEVGIDNGTVNTNIFVTIDMLLAIDKAKNYSSVSPYGIDNLYNVTIEKWVDGTMIFSVNGGIYK